MSMQNFPRRTESTATAERWESPIRRSRRMADLSREDSMMSPRKRVRTLASSSSSASGPSSLSSSDSPTAIWGKRPSPKVKRVAWLQAARGSG